VRAIERINIWLGETVSWAYLGAAVVTVWEVIARYVINAPTAWAFELAIFFCAVGYLLSGGSVTAREQHIAITSIFTIAPPGVAWWLRLFGLLVGVFAIGGLAIASYRSGLHAIRIVERTGSAWNAPTPAVIKPLIFVAAVLVMLQLVVQLVRHVSARLR
jgi:TRAP-type mannitol/chloroaromatic compound transport system permease small subunit